MQQTMDHIAHTHKPSTKEPSSAAAADWNPFSFSKIQTYIPLYTKLDKEEGGAETAILNTHSHICDLKTVVDTQTGKSRHADIFFKFSPLLDPIRYLIGKYDGTTDTSPALTELPTATTQGAVGKMADPNNCSFVDCFFYFLSSKLLHTHSLVNGIDFYGTFLGVQDRYRFNLYDDITYLRRHTYFNQTLGKVYEIYDKSYLRYLDEWSRQTDETRNSRKRHKVLLNMDSASIATLEGLNDLLGIQDLSGKGAVDYSADDLGCSLESFVSELADNHTPFDSSDCI